MSKVLYLKSMLSIVIVLGYVFLSIFSIFHMAHMAEMGMPVDHCPYMVGEQALCQMNTLDHLVAWQQQFTNAVFPPSVTLLIFALAVGTFLRYFSLPDKSLLYNKQRNRKIHSPLYRLLFSQGILNPKAP